MKTRGWWHGIIAGLLLSAVAVTGALYIVTLKLEIRRLEQACPAGEADSSPPTFTPPRRPLGPAEA